jgi:hypothetical protein
MEASRFESALSWLPAYSAVAAENKEPLSVEAVYRTNNDEPGPGSGPCQRRDSELPELFQEGEIESRSPCFQRQAAGFQ